MKIIASAKAINNGGIYATDIKSGSFSLLSDEPISVGGKNAAPSPADYLCMSLASCKAITLRMYANRKNWDIGQVSIAVSMAKSDSSTSAITTFFCELSFTGNLDDQQKMRLITISNACPISKLLSKPNEVTTTIV